MQREDALHPLTERHLADGERRSGPAPMEADDDAFEDLDAFLVALANLDMDPDRVARFDWGTLHGLGPFDMIDDVHFSAPSVNSREISSKANRSSALSSALASRSGLRCSVRRSD